LALAPALALAVAARQAARRGRRDAADDLPWLRVLLVACWAFVPPACLWALTALDVAPLWVRRYAIAAQIAPLVAMGLWVGLFRGRTRWWVGLACAAMFMAANGAQLSGIFHGRVVDRPQQDWRSAVAAVNNAAVGSDWPALVRSDLIEGRELETSDDRELREYCLLPVTSIYRLDATTRRRLVPLPTTRPGRMRSADLQAIAPHDGAWLIAAARTEKSKASIVAQVQAVLRRTGGPAHVTTQQQFDGVWVVCFERRPAGRPAN
ncbi:MAG: hypothetical protein KDA41_20740, partial [Planctomycetales bacterium]|nr:hypothetical protein [Planctomycetales bacterium]